MVSQAISHYRIIDKLGSGGMGEVYKARDTSLDRMVALKVLPSDLVEDKDRVRRFIQEAKAASALNHPHIVTIYEIGQEQPDSGRADSQAAVHYIAMELIDGETLGEKIHGSKTSFRRLLEILAQVAEGLVKAHGNGIVHRDLKPDNIMITQDGYAKILDFGLAKLIETEKTVASDSTQAATALMAQTQAGVVMGTVGYMSPEQAQGKTVDHRSDIFSFGCILYEAATGRKPFAGDSVIDTLHKIIYAEAPPVKDFFPGCPYEIQRIIRRCLAKDAEDRYQRIKDVAIDLRELLEEFKAELSGISSPAGVQSGYATTTIKEGLSFEPEIVETALDESDVRVQRVTRFTKSSVALVVLGIISAIIIWPVYQRYSLGSELKLDYTREAALSKAREVVTGLGYDISGLDKSINFYSGNLNLKVIAEREGIAEARRAIREGKVAAWNVIFSQSGRFGYMGSLKPGQFSLQIDPRGQLTSFNTPPREGVDAAPLEKQQALGMAEEASRRWLSIDPSGYETEFVARSNPPGVAEITWRNPDTVYAHREVVRANLQGDKITRLSRSFELPQGVGDSRSPWSEAINNARFTILIVASFAIYIFALLFMIKGRRWHALRHPLPIVATVTVALAVFLLISVGDNPNSGWFDALVVPTIMAVVCSIATFPSFAGIFEWLRGVSPARLFGAEQMVKRRFLSISVASSIVHGLFAGAIIAGISSILGALQEMAPGYAPSNLSIVQQINSGWPLAFAFSALGISMLLALGLAVVVELAEKFLPRKLMGTIVPTLVLSILLADLHDQPTLLVAALDFLAIFLTLIIAVQIYRSRGYAATWLAMATAWLLYQAVMTRSVEDTSLVMQSNVIVLILVLLLALGAWTYMRDRLMGRLKAFG